MSKVRLPNLSKNATYSHIKLLRVASPPQFTSTTNPNSSFNFTTNPNTLTNFTQFETSNHHTISSNIKHSQSKLPQSPILPSTVVNQDLSNTPISEKKTQSYKISRSAARGKYIYKNQRPETIHAGETKNNKLLRTLEDVILANTNSYETVEFSQPSISTTYSHHNKALSIEGPIINKSRLPKKPILTSKDLMHFKEKEIFRNQNDTESSIHHSRFKVSSSKVMNHSTSLPAIRGRTAAKTSSISRIKKLDLSPEQTAAMQAAQRISVELHQKKSQISNFSFGHGQKESIEEEVSPESCRKVMEELERTMSSPIHIRTKEADETDQNNQLSKTISFSYLNSILENKNEESEEDSIPKNRPSDMGDDYRGTEFLLRKEIKTQYHKILAKVFKKQSDSYGHNGKLNTDLPQEKKTLNKNRLTQFALALEKMKRKTSEDSDSKYTISYLQKIKDFKPRLINSISRLLIEEDKSDNLYRKFANNKYAEVFLKSSFTENENDFLEEVPTPQKNYLYVSPVPNRKKIKFMSTMALPKNISDYSKPISKRIEEEESKRENTSRANSPTTLNQLSAKNSGTVSVNPAKSAGSGNVTKALTPIIMTPLKTPQPGLSKAATTLNLHKNMRVNKREREKPEIEEKAEVMDKPFDVYSVFKYLEDHPEYLNPYKFPIRPMSNAKKNISKYLMKNNSQADFEHEEIASLNRVHLLKEIRKALLNKASDKDWTTTEQSLVEKLSSHLLNAEGVEYFRKQYLQSKQIQQKRKISRINSLNKMKSSRMKRVQSEAKIPKKSSFSQYRNYWYIDPSKRFIKFDQSFKNSSQQLREQTAKVLILPYDKFSGAEVFNAKEDKNSYNLKALQKSKGINIYKKALIKENKNIPNCLRNIE